MLAILHANGLFRAAGFGVYEVQSKAMEPTIPVNSRVIVDRRYYHARVPQNNEIIAFQRLESGNIYFIKRIIATSGQRIEIENDAIKVNSHLLEEPYALIEGPIPEDYKRDSESTIPSGKLFVVGDNRHISLDSRSPEFGLVDRSLVRGKALYVAPNKKHSVTVFK